MTRVCAILAAGAAQRMGGSKLDLAVGGRALFERALAACADLPAVAVVAPRLEELARRALAERAGESRCVINTEPELGMSHSLRLADAAIGHPEARIAVIPADLPFLDAAHVAAVFVASENAAADVTFPRRVRDGTPGHPVVFSPRARTAIAGLPPGDTLRALRDDPALVRFELASDDDAHFFDVDTPAALARAEELHRGRTRYPPA